ncbi:MAG: hypothetical protein ACR2FM_05825 [Candidatus Saccharimonadales bacterium]
MAYKRIIITLPEDFLRDLNTAVAVDYTKRSAYIREAIALKMRLESTIEQAVTDRGSMEVVVRSLHAKRLSRRDINKAGPSTWSQIQD